MDIPDPLARVEVVRADPVVFTLILNISPALVSTITLETDAVSWSLFTPFLKYANALAPATEDQEDPESVLFSRNASASVLFPLEPSNVT